MSTSTGIYVAAVTIAVGLAVGLPDGAPVGIASAETGPYRARAYDDGVAEGESVTSPSRRSQLESVLGREVRTRVEEDVGRIIDLLADRHGEVQAAVIEFGGFLGIGTRKIAVEWSALRFERDGKRTMVIVDLTRDQLRVAPEYKPNDPAIVRRVAD
jgi:PRC-barrel domain